MEEAGSLGLSRELARWHSNGVQRRELWGSTSVPGPSRPASFLAVWSPPKPPPTITTRGFSSGKREGGRGKSSTFGWRALVLCLQHEVPYSSLFPLPSSPAELQWQTGSRTPTELSSRNAGTRT